MCKSLLESALSLVSCVPGYNTRLGYLNLCPSIIKIREKFFLTKFIPYAELYVRVVTPDCRFTHKQGMQDFLKCEEQTVSLVLDETVVACKMAKVTDVGILCLSYQLFELFCRLIFD